MSNPFGEKIPFDEAGSIIMRNLAKVIKMLIGPKRGFVLIVTEMEKGGTANAVTDISAKDLEGVFKDANQSILAQEAKKSGPTMETKPFPLPWGARPK